MTSFSQILNQDLEQAHNANVQRNVTCGIYHNITTEFDYAKRDSRLAACGGVVLQRCKFINVCMGKQRFCWKSQLFLCFVNKFYLPCCCVVFFVVCIGVRAGGGG